MEIKLFGRSLFSAKKSQAEQLLGFVESQKKESKYLPDFHTGFAENSGFLSIADAVTYVGGKKKKKAVPKPKSDLTPKGAYELKLLHDETFELKTDPAYVDEQLATFRDKLALISSEEYDMRRGVNEISSIVMRLENRKKYPEVKEFFDDYPYTTSGRIEDLVKKHDHLKLGQVAQFLADMPKEASDTMKKYNTETAKVCGKQAVYYIIAEKKDFEKTAKRRDPILLAQSPFGHFWQILGAWDKEMLLVDEL